MIIKIIIILIIIIGAYFTSNDKYNSKFKFDFVLVYKHSYKMFESISRYDNCQLQIFFSRWKILILIIFN